MRALTFFLLAINFNLASQTNTLCNSYTISVPLNNGLWPLSIVYGNSLFLVLSEMNGTTLTKMDLNGVPISKITYPIGLGITEINARNGALFISGVTGAVNQSFPFLLKVDTINCGIDFFREYPITNFNSITIQETKFLNNNDIVMVGSVGNYTSMGSLPVYGLFMGINSSNGNLVYTNTVSVNGSNVNYIYSLCEISNSSIIFSGILQGSGFIGRAVKTTNSFSINSVYWSDFGVNPHLENTSNPKKLIVISGASYSNTVFKIDTALNLISGNSPGLSLGQAYGEKTFYYNDKIYYSSPANYLRIYDTSLTFLSSNSYPFISGLNSSYNINNITFSSNNIFSFFSDQQSYSKYYLLKTDLNGQMNCSVSQADNSVPVNMNALLINFSSGVQSAGSNTLSMVTNTGTIQYESTCNNVGLNSISIDQSLVNVFPIPAKDELNLTFDLNVEGKFKSISVYNSLGQVVREEEIEFKNNKLVLKTNDLANGLYIFKLKDQSNFVISKRFVVAR